jgi:hypothetical protein
MTADPPASPETLRDHLATLCENFNEDPPACPVERLLQLDRLQALRRRLEEAERKKAGPAPTGTGQEKNT